MPIEFQVPSLRLQIAERLPESESEQQPLMQLLELGEDRIAGLAQLEHGQRRHKAFIDRHHRNPDRGFEIASQKYILRVQT